MNYFFEIMFIKMDGPKNLHDNESVASTSNEGLLYYKEFFVSNFFLKFYLPIHKKKHACVCG